MRFLVLVQLLLSATAFGLTLVKSTTTSIDPSACLQIKTSSFDKPGNELPYDYYENECQGFGGYQIVTNGKDMSDSLALKFKDSRMDFETPTAVQSLSGGSVEWRYEHNENQAVEMKALIYKIHSVDLGTLVSQDLFYVVRLNKEKSCLVGKIPDMDAARSLADDIKAKCL